MYPILVAGTESSCLVINRYIEILFVLISCGTVVTWDGSFQLYVEEIL